MPWLRTSWWAVGSEETGAESSPRLSNSSEVAGIGKQIATTLKMMPIPEGVSIPFFANHLDKGTGVFDPGEIQEKASTAMLNELERWAAALAPLRKG